MAVAVSLLDQFSDNSHLALMALKLALGGIVYLLAFAVTGLTPQERHWILGKLRHAKMTSARPQESL